MISFDVMVTNKASMLHYLHVTSGRTARILAGRDRSNETYLNKWDRSLENCWIVQTVMHQYINIIKTIIY